MDVTPATGPTHDVYRIVDGEYEYTSCWCKADYTHYIGHEEY